MEEADFRKIEQELQLGLNPMSMFQTKGLDNQGWGNTSFGKLFFFKFQSQI